MVLLAPVLVALTLTLAPGQNPTQNDPQEKKVEAPDAKPPTPVHTGFRALVVGIGDDIKHLPSKENLYIAGIGGALALGTRPVDHDLNVRLLNQYPVVNTIFAPAKYYGDTPEQMGLSIGTWMLGRLLHMPKMSHLGMDLLRAQALTEIMVEPLKLAVGRERPDGSNSQSFPSGHSAITFAAATVIERHLGWKHRIAAYAIASYVAASRDTWTFGPTAVRGGIAISATRAGF